MPVRTDRISPASKSTITWVSPRPLGKWNFDIAAYYVTYPGAFDPDGEFNYVEIWTGVTRSFFDDKLELTI